MKLNCKLAWLKKLKAEGGTDFSENFSWRNDDHWSEIEVEGCSSKDLEILLKIAQASPEKGCRAVIQKINIFHKLKADLTGTKITRLEGLEHAMRAYIGASAHKWVFEEVTDEQVVPWYVKSVKYHPPDERKEDCAHVILSVAATRNNEKVEKNKRWEMPDLGESVVAILQKAGYYLETPEAVETYEKQMDYYQAVQGLTGEQFYGTGFAYESRSHRHSYYNSTLTSLEREGIPARLVMDDMVNEEGETKLAKGNTVSAAYWIDKKQDADEMDKEEKVCAVPIQPYVKVFDLEKHCFFHVHTSNLKAYEYDPALIDKLILPTERKDLLSILVAGADVQLEDIVRGKTGGIIVICTGPPGTGKCHGRGTRLLKYDGTTVAVEDVRVGDLLMGDDSTPRTVLSLAAGKGDMYRVSPLRGGAPFTVNRDHIMVFAESPTKADERVGTVEMSLCDYFKQSRTRKHRLKLYRVPVDYPESTEPTIDPYWLGLWLGDGNAGYTGITTMDAPVVDYVRAYAKTLGLGVSVKTIPDNKASMYTIVGTCVGVYHDNVLLRKMDALGLSVLTPLPAQDKRSRHGSEKFIPHCYLTGSRKTRMQLLAGILDSDGYTFGGDGVYDAVFKSQRFSTELVQLARSLGYTASVAPKKGTIKSIGFTGDYYRVCLSAVHDLPLKIARRKSTAVRGQKKRAQVTGFTLEKLGVDDYFGFTLTGNGRYLLADFTVTHNTLSAEVFSELVKRPLYCVQCSQLGTNEEALEKELNIVLSRSVRWKAILLIDEADVYTHERGEDIQQNAIVGVFLRVLEHYRGVMFMTSNRDTIIDDAIMSRATAWIQYDYPEPKALAEIWRVLSDNYAVELSKEDITELCKVFPRISGRSIKSLLRLGRLLVSKKGGRVDVKLLHYVSQFIDLDGKKRNKPNALATGR